MRRTTIAAIAATLLALLGAQPAHAKACPNFIVGNANSTAYDGMKLPARGVTARQIQCAGVRSLARAFHRGDLNIPDYAQSSGSWGRTFDIAYRGRSWHCQFWSVGASGPTYRFRCHWGARRATWRTG